MSERKTLDSFYCRWLLRERTLGQCAESSRFATCAHSTPDEFGLTARHSPCCRCPVGLRVRSGIRKSIFTSSVPDSEPKNGTHSTLASAVSPRGDKGITHQSSSNLVHSIRLEDHFFCKWLDREVTYDECLSGYTEANASTVQHSPCYWCLRGLRHRKQFARS